ncbi:MAG: hypothetical protein K9N34_08970 [Candidatus Marinimicrobia bacterium]|nr:hypothetical protein [Candidatus Neomarinimicrobiota bacterium]MCF7903022.1 hypothetical protein [Candidatus Neomarinimicrobiota bacterium]
MDLDILQKPIKILLFPFRLLIYVGIVLIIANVNAVVDMFQHPDIPYFDEEHLIVGFVAGLISVAVLVILEIFFRHLSRALHQIKVLESFLSICANCKKIRIPGTDPQKKESWKPIEAYISENTDTIFSHGICPGCYEKYYSDSKDIE